MCERIRAVYPGHAVVCEEDADYLAAMPQPGTTRYCWVIDPLDGTRNFVRGIPCYGTSIALLEEGTPVVGVIRNHTTADLYTAIRGEGAYTGGRRMRVSEEPFDHRTIVAFQPAKQGGAYQIASVWLNDVLIRNLGSTALHLAMVADGALDGAVCAENRLWDLAAGALIIQEAGGIVTDLTGRDWFPFNLAGGAGLLTPVVAGTPRTHGPLLDGLRV
jgi:myo-inositol-1(or 4)-monophosphatase